MKRRYQPIHKLSPARSLYFTDVVLQFTVRERAYGFMNTRIFIPLGFIWTYQRQKFNPNLTSEIKVKYPAKCIICIAHTFKKDKIAGFLS